MKLIALLLLLPVITWAAGPADNDVDFDGRLRTEHFDFRFPADQGPAVRDIARFAEGFPAVLQKDFVDPKFAYPIKVLVLPTREAFQGYLRSRLTVALPTRVRYPPRRAQGVRHLLLVGPRDFRARDHASAGRAQSAEASGVRERGNPELLREVPGLLGWRCPRAALRLPEPLAQ